MFNNSNVQAAVTKKQISGAPKSEQTRSRIVETALRLFSEFGFEKTTMRAVAQEAGLSPGAAYYYFGSKEELVLAFYQATAYDAEVVNPGLISGTKDFKNRFKAILLFKFEQLDEHRHLIRILARHAADFSHPLSPFGQKTKPTRDSAIMLIEHAIVGSTLKSHRSLRPHIASLCWLYQMSLILYWANDRSENQEKTTELVGLTLGVLDKLLRLSSIPLFAPINRAVSKIIRVVLSGLEVTGNDTRCGENVEAQQ